MIYKTRKEVRSKGITGLEHFWRNVQTYRDTIIPGEESRQGSVNMMAETSLKLVQGGAAVDIEGVATEAQKVSMDTLSMMTGFPADFIKSELIVEGEDLSVSDLRKTMINFLEKNKDLLN